MGKLQINFTPPASAPANGYRVRYKKTTDPDYITLAPNPTSSPVVISNLENGVSYNVTIESNCSNEVYSPVIGLVAAPSKTFYACGATITDTYAPSAYYTYADKHIDVYNSDISQLLFNFNANDRPNRFTVYDENGLLVATSGWVGTASYSGPWGASLSTSPSGSLTVIRDPGSTYYSLRVEAGPANPASPISDSWTVQVLCAY